MLQMHVSSPLSLQYVWKWSVCLNCLVICSEATSSFSVTAVAISSVKVLWNSPTIRKATALMMLVMCSGILASKDVEISKFMRVVMS